MLIGRGTMQSPDRHPDGLDIHMIDLAADGTVDLDGRYEAFLKEHGLAAMLVRPDFVVFGGAARIEEAGALLDRLGTRRLDQTRWRGGEIGGRAIPRRPDPRPVDADPGRDQR